MHLRLGPFYVAFGRAPLAPLPSMRRQEVHDAVRSAPPAVRDAVTTLIDTTITAVEIQLEDPRMARHHGDLAHAAGGVAWLRELRSRWLLAWEQARPEHE